MTKLGDKKIHTVRTMGGNTKYRALRLDAGNFSWPSEAMTKKTRIIDVHYNGANMEYVRTKILTKGAIVSIDATPFRQWFADKYAKPMGEKKVDARNAGFKIDSAISEQVSAGRLLACITSRP